MSLDAQQEQFDRMRRLEKNAPANLAAVRESISATATALPRRKKPHAELESTYTPSAIASVAENLDAAQQQLTRASARWPMLPGQA